MYTYIYERESSALLPESTTSCRGFFPSSLPVPLVCHSFATVFPTVGCVAASAANTEPKDYKMLI